MFCQTERERNDHARERESLAARVTRLKEEELALRERVRSRLQEEEEALRASARGRVREDDERVQRESATREELQKKGHIKELLVVLLKEKTAREGVRG